MTASIHAAEHRRANRSLGVGCLVFLGLLLAAPSSAELVIFADGSFLKIESYRVESRAGKKKVRLELPSGGALVVPLRRVARILDDEIARLPVPEEPPTFQVRFDPSQAVPSVPYADLIREVSERHGLNPALVAAVASAESSYDPSAISHKGAQGLMQLMPATAARFGLTAEQVFEPSLNLDAGSRYLRWLADRFEDDLGLVLAAYNAGEGTVDRYEGIPPYRETRTYVRRIFSRLGIADPPS